MVWTVKNLCFFCSSVSLEELGLDEETLGDRGDFALRLGFLFGSRRSRALRAKEVGGTKRWVRAFFFFFPK